MSTVADRIRKLEITLPAPSAPGANYVPWVRTGNLLCVTGQLPKWEGERRYLGRVGAEFDLAEGQAAARLCALNILAVLREALDGDLERVVRCVRVRGFVNTAPGFTGHSQVMDGASNLFVDVLGEAGRHARTAVGATLPYDCAVEVEADFEVR